MAEILETFGYDPQMPVQRRQANRRTAAILLFVLGCGAEEPVVERPNIVLVTLCSMRLSHAGFAGYDRPTTPFLDHLAATGTVFDNAFSASSWTKPATASLVTGLTPNVHQLVDGYRTEDILSGAASERRVLPEGVPTLAESLRDAGYATACRVNNVHAGEFFNLTRGCDDAVTRYRMKTSQMVDDLADWLKRRSEGGGNDARPGHEADTDRPFFFSIFTLDAHAPYTPEYEDFRRFQRGEPVAEAKFAAYVETTHRGVWRLLSEGEDVPAELRERWIDLYDAALASLDRRLSQLPGVLEAAGEASNTAIVVTADHGESFFEPGRSGFRLATHGFDLAEALIRIPMIFHGPGISPGLRVSPVVRSIDVFPTLMELAQAKRPEHLQGHSLVRVLGGEIDALPIVTAFSSRASGHHHAVHDGRFKLHLRPPDRHKLYDTRSDPAEIQDLLTERPEEARRLSQELAIWLHQEEALRARFNEVWSREPTPDVVEELRTLGYL